MKTHSGPETHQRGARGGGGMPAAKSTERSFKLNMLLMQTFAGVPACVLLEGQGSSNWPGSGI